MMMIALLLASSLMQPPAPAAATGTPGQEYRIGAGDILRVTVYGHEDLTQTVLVQPNGTFVFPLLGPLRAGEATPAEVEANLRRLLSAGLIRDPKVTVVVQEYRSKVVHVMGEVAKPGPYPLAGETRVVELLSRAGPLSANAGTEVVVVRPHGGGDRAVLPSEVAAGGAAPSADVLRTDIREVQAGRLDRNLLLRPGDTLFVPEAGRFFVSGEVRSPGAFPFRPGLTVRQAVSLAGGFTEDASKGSARIVREVDGKPRTLKVGLDEPVQVGDTVLLKAKLF
jgi:polysaccharide biosynthesis/export protein